MAQTIYSKTELETIIHWRKKGITPQALFEFDNDDAHLNDDEGKIEKKYRQLSIKFHPDKYLNTSYQPDAKEVFTLFSEAKAYLLFRLNGTQEGIQNNIFYQYYHLEILPNLTLEDKFENLIQRTCDLKRNNQSIDAQLTEFRALITQYPHLLDCEYDKTFDSYEMSDKNILFFAVQWNEPSFLIWLLEQGADEENIFKKTTFDVSPFEHAIQYNHFDILIRLKLHLGDSWLKNHVKRYLDPHELCKFLVRKNLTGFYLQQYPEELTDFLKSPILIPGLIELGIIEDNDLSELRLAIIHCPQVYLIIEKSMRLKLSLGFSVALADSFPILKNKVESTLHRDSPPYNNYVNYNLLKNLGLFFLISNSLGLLMWYFFPLVLLLPKIIIFMMGMIIPLLAVVSTIFFIGGALYYFSKIYPEAQKINAELMKNSIFCVPPEKVIPKSDLSNISWDQPPSK
jgi:hypothetical protein